MATGINCVKSLGLFTRVMALHVIACFHTAADSVIQCYHLYHQCEGDAEYDGTELC